MEQNYRVLVAGTFTAGLDSEAVKSNLIRVFKLSESQADRLVSGKPLVVKDNIDLASAEKFRSAFEKAGLVCRLETAAAAVAAGDTPQQTACLHKVIFTGTVAMDHSVQDVKFALARLLKTDAQKIGQMITGKPVVIKSGLDRQSALTLQTMLNKAGAPSVIDPPLAAVAQELTQSQAAEPAPATGKAAPAKSAVPRKGVALTGKPQQPKVLAPEGTTTGIKITPSFFPLAILMYFSVPHVEINGEDHKIDWNKTAFLPLYPGAYTLRIFVPYPSNPELGLIKKEITIGERAPSKYDYYVSPWSSTPGTLTIKGLKVAVVHKAKEHDSKKESQPVLLKRLGAAGIDSAILGLCIGLVIVGLSAALALPLNVVLSNGFFHIGVQAVLYLYFGLLESSAWQATVGKKLLSLKVTDYEGNRISFLRATLRHISRLLLLPCTLFIGFLMIAFTQQKQGLHDRTSQSLVVDA